MIHQIENRATSQPGTMWFARTNHGRWRLPRDVSTLLVPPNHVNCSAIESGAPSKPPPPGVPAGIANSSRLTFVSGGTHTQVLELFTFETTTPSSLPGTCSGAQFFLSVHSNCFPSPVQVQSAIALHHPFTRTVVFMNPNKVRHSFLHDGLLIDPMQAMVQALTDLSTTI
jgi:hypothetical protein